MTEENLTTDCLIHVKSFEKAYDFLQEFARSGWIMIFPLETVRSDFGKCLIKAFPSIESPTRSRMRFSARSWQSTRIRKFLSDFDWWPLST